ncbi:DUF4376 domain-containing protein [Xanthobacter agilis]|uniref:DUF4376 domain-containing protein n=1 Tax=Xanthobacter agilis TaxID=47492 RepID=A0ABU0LJW2_XANAG|nr:DUF4376 domain-containing protein [Xanthobacter agilis]MDQ0507431.1 hypothetical protein [Xanthobacter agilis]
MPQIAIIENNAVSNILDADDGWTTTFPDAVLVVGKVKIGYSYNGSTFAAPEPSPSTSSELLAYASVKRYRVETGGAEVFGFPVKTGRDDRTLIYEAEATSKADSAYITTWFDAAGVGHELNAEMVIALANAVRAHVAACFSTYTSVIASIADGTITTTGAIDAALWPENS